MQSELQNQRGLTIAVIGGGAAGISASLLLQRRHAVTVFEKNTYLGGHTNTIVIPSGPDAGLGVDTGFIVLNDQCYPTLHAMLRELKVGWRYTDMSFSVHDPEINLQWGSRDLNHIFAQRSNLFRPRFVRMLLDMKRFWKAARQALADPATKTETLGSFLARHKLEGAIATDYIIPIGAAIWSSPVQGMLDFPAHTFLNFFANHGLLSFTNQPRWQTVVGGSSSYVKAFQKKFEGAFRTESPVRRITRHAGKVEITLGDGNLREFDHVVLAVHADEVLTLLADASPEERKLFGSWRYQENRTILHTDSSLLPPLRRAWAAWNYRKEVGAAGIAPISVTYWMNLLQGFSTKNFYGVTLNPRREFQAKAVVKEISYHHPVYSAASVATQETLRALSGTNRTWFAGSYFGYGFHEDAVKAGAAVGKAFGETFV